MESSDNSFTWTDTSSDSFDSPSMVAEDSTESDNHLKTKSSCNKTKVEHDNLVNVEKNYQSEMKSSPKKKVVKVEAESDCDVPRKIKKIKNIEINGYQKDSLDSSAYEESYLDLKVKQEEITLANKTKKKKKQNVSANESDLETGIRKTEIRLDAYDDHQNVQCDTDSKTKKKRKKSKRKNESDDQELVERDVSYEMDPGDMIIDKPKTDTDKCINQTDENLQTENTFENDETNEISAIQSDEHNLHILSFNCGRNVDKENKKDDSLYKSTLINQFDIQTERKKTRLSDRIRFEDDSENELSQDYQHGRHKTSSKLQTFIKTSHSMKLISEELHHSSNITCEDEIWIVHCPKEVDVHSFCGIDLNIHGKSKIKIGSQTFDGILDDESDTTAVLSTENGNYQIKNLPLRGLLKFRKRIPKAHFHDNNIMVNNQTNFIPLPETKCRHPLFGSNYKKALKVPVTIAQRLHVQSGEDVAVTIDKRKKKNKKKVMSLVDYEEIDSKCEVSKMLEPDLTVNVTDKKKKKRKYIDDEGPSPKRIKKIKHDPESEEAWESEKAIEQNLFTF